MPTTISGGQTLTFDPSFYSGFSEGMLYNPYGRESIIRDEDRKIHSYNYIPKEFIFHSVKNEKPLYMGVELEIDKGGESEDVAQNIYKIINKEYENVYCKHDGSLSSGFEIVTHPMTFEYHQTLNYKLLFKTLSDLGYRSHDTTTCGMHVHVNRNYFGSTKLEQDLCISKLLYLLEKFWDKVETVARRKSNSYATRFLLEENDSPLDLYAKSKDSKKYGAVNLQHKDTVEIRIFKGTLNYNTYMNTLEFVRSMVLLAIETDIYNIQFTTWDKITDTFSDNLNQYIFEREEKQKEEDKQRVINNRESIGLTTDSPSNFYVTSNAYLSSLMNNITSTTFTSDAFETHEETTEERLIKDINDLKVKIRRSRNGLEITNLRRELAGLERDLRDERYNIRRVK